MAETKPEAIKLRKITIDNIKVIDHLELEFPEPLMKGDPDVFVLGSKNGFGKTSVLESCALILSALVFGKKTGDVFSGSSSAYNLLFELSIRSEEAEATIRGEFALENEPISLDFSMVRSREKVGRLRLLGGAILVRGNALDALEKRGVGNEAEDKPPLSGNLVLPLIGLVADPFILGSYMYFHSYRKVREGNASLADIVDQQSFPSQDRAKQRWGSPVSAFKTEVLRSMMSQAGLFEAQDPSEEEALDKLNELLGRYAGGRLTKLRPLADNTLDFRVSTGPNGRTFSFDGLSSGQKEIISTLYLIWKHTRNRPGIVLIDEPELHLNHEWHRDFVRQLHNLAPDNQYILATHSEDIFASVPEDRRVLLEISKDQGA